VTVQILKTCRRDWQTGHFLITHYTRFDFAAHNPSYHASRGSSISKLLN